MKEHARTSDMTHSVASTCGRRLSVVFAVMVLLRSPVNAQNVQHDSTIIPRIGDTLTSYERRYFNLFPNMPGFRHAVMHGSRDGGASCVCYWGVGDSVRTSVLSLDQYMVRQLRTYIDEYESDTPLIVPELSDLHSFITDLYGPRKQRFTPVRHTVYVATRQGLFSGNTVGIVHDTMLVIDTTEECFDWRKPAARYVSFPLTRIDTVVAVQSEGTKGMLIGGIVWALAVFIGQELWTNYSPHGQRPEGHVWISVAFASIAGLTGSLLGGVIGAIIHKRNYYIIDSPQKYNVLRERLREGCQFPGLLPPEILRALHVTNPG